MIAAVVMTFAAVFLIIIAMFCAVKEARQSPAAEMKKRLRRITEPSLDGSSGALSGDLFRSISPTEQFVFQLPLLANVKKLVEQSGVKISPTLFTVVTGMVSVAGFIVLFALKKNFLVALLAPILISIIAIIYLAYRKQQWQSRFTEQLPDVLTMIGRSLRAGHSLTGATELVGQEMAEPAGGLFKIAYEQQKLGMRITDSLETLLEKVDSLDLRFFVTIVRINSETGGNLAEILDKLSETITQRLQIRRQVKVFTAEGRLSGYVLVLLPLVLFFVFSYMRPGYMNVFYTERICQITLAAAVLAQIIGYFIIRNITNIRI